MAVVLDEHKSYQDASGTPLSGGFLAFGIVNTDPVANPISIFSDRELTVSITNPVTLNASGRSPTKVWIPGKYSLRVANSADVQVYQDLDNGESSGGLTSIFVTGISGADTITGSTSEGLTSYTDNQLFQFTTAVSPNTTNVTLDVDGVGAKAVVKNHDQALVAGDLEASQSVIVMYNSVGDNFELSNKSDSDIIQDISGLTQATDTIPYFDTATTAALLNFHDEDDMSSDDPLGVNSEQGTKAYIDGLIAALPFTESFESSEQTITSAGALVIPHGLSSKPLIMDFYLRSTVAEFGYSIGDEISISNDRGPDGGGGADTGISATFDATNINIRYGADVGVFRQLNKGTGVGVTLTNGSWRLLVRAYA